ncbi:MAG: rhodanese-like domain-containing protein [Chitinophagales bacterium]|nr:rhodanese-like domain-containing protein [Chitinophagales bacterium]
MKYLLAILGLLILGTSACAQIPEERPLIMNPDFDHKISHTINFTIPTIGAKEAWENRESVVFLDAREEEEYKVSHIEKALFIGYKNPDYSKLDVLPKDSPIVIYCSIGYRSEKIGEELKKRGFVNIHNMYGSIFEWVNQGYPIVDKNREHTNKLHTYNEKWSQWVEDNKVQKVW